MTKRKTAEELMAALAADAEYLARQRDQERTRQKAMDEAAKAEAPLREALSMAGVHVHSVWDLINKQWLPEAAIPVLLREAKNPAYPSQTREDMFRALANPNARTHWKELVGFFEKNLDSLPAERRYVVAVALHAAADETVIADVVRLASDVSFGPSRLPLLLALKDSKSPQARMALLQLRNDPELGKEVKRLRRLGRKSQG